MAGNLLLQAGAVDTMAASFPGIIMRFHVKMLIGAPLVLLLGSVASAEPAPEKAAALLSIPEAPAITKAREMIRGVFKDDFSKTGFPARQALAKRLLTEALATKDDMAARYVLLSDGADMAASAGDCETAIKALRELAKSYTVDGLELQRAALLRANAVITTPDAAEALVRLAIETADAAVLADSFEAVTQLANLAEAAANKTRKVAVVAGIQVRLAELRSLVKEYEQVRAAMDFLVKKPGDAGSHLVVGKFYALHKGQWEAGLPHLAGCSDSELKALAVKELANPADGVAQTALGDAWWEFAEKSSGLAKVHAHRHARMWYERSEKSITGITLARIQQRLKTGAPVADVGKPATKPVVQVAGPATGAAVNLLNMIDVAKDAADGKWAVENGAIVVASGKYSVLQLPYLPPEEYDLKVSFTRNDGEGPINLLLASHKKAFGFALDVKGEARFERVGNKIAKDNPTTVPVAISNGRKYTVCVQVRKDGLTALLDDKQITQWKTDYKDMNRYLLWKMPDDKLCGVGANLSKVTFHSIEMVEVSGAGKAIR